jgi:hypothetical protein
MRFEDDGLAVWYGTPDTPGPPDPAPADVEMVVVIGAAPPDPDNEVALQFRVDGSEILTVPAAWLRDADGARYFAARLPPFRENTHVAYWATLSSAGRSVPRSESDAVLSFDVGPAALVYGRIRGRHGGPLAGVRVSAFLESVNGSDQAGTTVTDDEGTYQLEYRRPHVGRRIALVVRAYGLDGTELAACPALFAPAQDEQVDLEMPVLERAGSEYDQVRADVAAVLDGGDLSDVAADRLGFVAEAAGVDEGRVTALAAAQRRTADTGLPAALLYGLFRQGPSAARDALLRQDPQTLTRTLAEAVRAQAVPLAAADQRVDLGDRLVAARVAALLAPAGKDAPASLGDLLATVVDDPPRREAVARVALERDPEDPRFWEALAEADCLEPAAASRLRLTFDLAAVAGRHLPAIRELQRRGGTENDLREFARYDEAAWREVAAAAGPPAGTAGTSERERIDTCGRQLALAFETLHPTAVIAARIEQGSFPAAPEMRAPLARFLTDNPGFELGRQPAEAFCAPGAGADLTSIPDDLRPQLVTELRRLERVVNVVPTGDGFGPRHAAAATLLREGFDSANRIARQGRDEFVARLSRTLDGGQQEAAAIHRRAEDVSAMAAALLSKYGQAFQPTDLPVLASVAGTTIPGPVPGSGVPDLRTLFGNLDACECQSCRSVLSPAAYLVDALHFLADRTLPGAGTLKDVVLSLGRRPDLAQIELTCANTNTRMPYADLVCEILEHAVSPRPPDARYPQTSWSEAELGACPEYLHGPAYEVLRDARYPWHLPFDFWSEEVDAYLGQLDLRRSDVMGALRPTEPLTNFVVACERLGVSAGEAEILTAAEPPEPWAAWGLDEQVVKLRDQRDGSTVSGPWDEVLRGRVSIILQQSGLSHEELRDFLDTRYVNPTRLSPTIVGDACDLTKMSVPWLTVAALNRLHRFARLWRRLAWSVPQTDTALAAHGPDITRDLLIRISHVVRIQALLHLPIASVLNWWSLLDTHRYATETAGSALPPRSAYDLVFLNPAVVDPPPAALALNAARTELAAPWSVDYPERTILSQGIPIAAAIGLDMADLARLVGAGVPDRLSLANLSALHAMATLIRTLGLSAREYLQIRQLVGIDPLHTTVAAIDFVEDVARIRDSGLSVAEVDYLLRDRAALTDRVALTAEDATRTLTELRDGLRRIADEMWAPPDPQGEHTRRFLGRLGWDDDAVTAVVGEAMLGRNPRTETELTALPAGVDFDTGIGAALRGRVGFEEDRERIWCLGALRTQEGDELRGLPDDPQSVEAQAYLDAVDRLYSASRAGLDDRMQLIGQAMQSFRLPTFTTELTLSTPLAALPADVILSDDLPEELRTRLVYDAPAGVLRCSGPMTAAEVAKVAGLAPGDQNWLEALEKLRLTFTVPSALAARFSYDPGTRNLRLVGWISEAEQQTLLSLASHAGYRAAVDALYSAMESYIETEPTNRFLTAEDLARLIFDAPSTAERFAVVLGILLPHLRREASTDFVVQTLSTVLTLEQELTADLLRRLTSPGRPTVPALNAFTDPEFAAGSSTVPVTRAASPDQDALLRRLHKVALLVGRLGLSAREMTTFAQPADRAALDALPVRPATANADGYAFLIRMLTMVGLRDSVPAGSEVLTAILAAAAGAPTRESIYPVLETTLGWSRADIEFLVSPDRLGLTAPADFADARKLRWLFDCFRLLGRLGMSAEQTWALSGARIGQQDATTVRQAVRARVEPSTWLERAKTLRDGLRNRQRASLVAYLVARDRLRGPDDLYGWYLIDVEMDAGASTSRIRQAMASVQLFVQRCLLGLESRGTPLYRLLESDRHFYTASAAERDHAVSVLRNGDEGVACHVFAEPAGATTPFFHAVRPGQLGATLHFYTTSAAERGSMVANQGFIDAGVACHVFAEQYDGTTALFRLYYPGTPDEDNSDYIYTISVAERDFLTTYQSYLYEGVACYVPLTVTPSAVPVQKWRWLKNYRVWEAARLVFLLPENWTEPELRDDKSPFFQELEGELGQGDLTQDTAILAFGHYLEKLEQVARLEIMGVCRHRTADGEVLHLFARTFNTPHAYFYRRLRDGEWSPWERVDLDIEGNHLLPVIWNDQLLLFWTRLNSQAVEPETIPNTGQKPDKRHQLQLAWSQYKSGRWQATQLLDSPLATVKLEDTPAREFFLAPLQQATDLTLGIGYPSIAEQSYRWRLAQLPRTRGRLILDQRQPSAGDWLIPFFPYLPFADVYNNAGVETPTSGQNPLLMWLAPTTSTGAIDRRAQMEIRTILNRRPEAAADHFRLVFALQSDMFWDDGTAVLGTAVMQDGLFFEDRRRTYQATYVEGDDAKTRRHNMTFAAHFHPYAAEFTRRFALGGLSALLSLDTQRLADGGRITLPDGTQAAVTSGAAFRNDYRPNLDTVLPATLPTEIVDFRGGAPYSLYNWELFFHAPLLVALRLTRNQRFEEAQQWFHYIFNPMTNSSAPEPGRYWNVLPFHQAGQGSQIQELMELLADKTSASPMREQFKAQVRRWQNDPLNPHAVARWRTVAYQRFVVFRYFDMLISWADQLFRRDTTESINEATQLYLLADRILGRRPERIRRRGDGGVHTYASLEPALDELSNALVAVESLVPAVGTDAGAAAPAPPPATTLYFCVPPNKQLLDRWDRVADRLFKIRHGMNIEGIARPLPLFDPPLDPAWLIQAAAAGVDIGSMLLEAGGSASPYRYEVLVQKASELCGEVKSLGGQLLSALEHKDAEALTRLRSGQELAVLESARTVRAEHVEEVKQELEALGKSAEMAATRLKYYTGLLQALERVGVPGPGVTALGDRLAGQLTSMVAGLAPHLEAVKATLQLVSVVSPHAREALRSLEEAMSPSAESGPTQTTAVPMSPFEKRQLDELAASHDKQLQAREFEALAAVLALIPDFTLGIQGWAASPVVQAQLGGTLLSTVARLKASGMSYEADQHSYQANLHSILAGYQRRAEEWTHQAHLALAEGELVGKQMLAAGVRLRTAVLELRNHDQQIEHARTTDDMLRDKYTNAQLYEWLSGQLSAVYLATYQLAYDTAKRAERAFRFELGLPDATYIKFGYWDNLHKGLLAGERLHQDLRRIEVAYLEQHRRGPELVKHIALSQVDPAALARLRVTGSCEVELPEALFDLDHPGHHYRRIQRISISVPCVVGPYTGVNGTLTLLRSSTRTSVRLDGGYARATDQSGAPADDPRFVDEFGPDSIAFSSGQVDSGILDTGPDGRYLPCEGRGVISRWRLELPRDFPAFDYDSIADVVLHVNYTARNGGRQLADAATAALRANLNDLMRTASEPDGGFTRLFSLRHELTGWNTLTGDQGDRSQNLALAGRFPLLFRGRTISIDRVDLLIQGRGPLAPKVIGELAKATFGTTPLTGLGTWNGVRNTLRIRLPDLTWNPADQDRTLSFAGVAASAVAQVSDVWLLCHYTVTPAGNR